MENETNAFDPWAEFPSADQYELELQQQAESAGDTVATDVDDPWAEFLAVEQPVAQGLSPQDAMAAIPTGVGDEPINAHTMDDGTVREDQFRPEANDAAGWNFEDTALEAGMPEMFEEIIGGVFNAPRNVAETGASILGTARDALSGSDTVGDFKEVADVVWPKYQTPEDREGIASDVAKGLGEFAGGVGTLKKGIDLVTEIPKASRWLKGVLFEGAGVAGMDSSTETMLPEGFSASGALELLGKDEAGNFSQEVAERKLDLLVEALALTKAAELGIRGGVGLKNVVRDYLLIPIGSLGNPERIGVATTRDTLNSLVEVDPRDTPAQVAAKYQKVINHVDNGAYVEIKSGIEGVDDIAFNRDTMSAIEKGSDGDPGVVSRARSLRAGLEGKGSPELEVAMAKPSFVGDEFLGQMQTAAGGDDAVTKTREGIQTSVKTQTDEALQEVQGLRDRVLTNEIDMMDEIYSDPVFGEEIKRLGNRTNIDLNTPSRMKADEIVARVEQASDVMTKEKNLKYDAIPDDAPVDYDSINQVIQDYSSYFDPEFLEALQKVGGNYKSLREFSNNEISQRLGSAIKSGDRSVSALKALKKNIDETQIEWLSQNGRPDVKEAADEALRYFKEEYAPFWRDGRLEDVQYLGREHFVEPLNKQVKQRDVITSTLNDGTRPEYQKQIVDLMSRPEGGGDPKVAVDYVLARVGADVQSILNANGKLSPEDITRFGNELSDFVPVFERAAPEQVERLNNFITKVRNKNLSTQDLKGLVKEKEGELAALEKKLFGEEFSPFFDSARKPNIDNTSVFRDVFKSENVLRDLPSIIERAGPEGLPGLRAAASKELQSMIFRDAEGIAGERLTNPMNKESLDRMYKSLDLLFPDNQVAKDAIRAVSETVLEARQGTTRRQPVFDLSQVAKGSRGAVDLLITMVWGPLSRTGARLRAGAGRVIAGMDSTEEAKAVMDKIFSDPDEFKRLAQKVIAETTSGQNEATKQMRSDFVKWFGTAGMYGPRRAEEDRQTEDLFSDF